MDAKASASSSPPGLHDAEKRPKSTMARVIVAVVVVVVVLALALGLGLGLGLKHSKSHSPSSTSSPGNGTNSTNPSADALASLAVPPWRQNTEDYTLDFTDWDLNAPPTTREYHWTFTEVELAPDGVSRTMTVINGRFPGPVVRANRGDRIVVHVTNQLTNATTVHWHGMFQNGTNWMDGTSGITQCAIPPNRTFTYNFTVENQYGTYWYHSHYGTQYSDGLVGPLIIHAPEEKTAQQEYDVDQVVLLSDWYHDLSAALLPAYLAPDNENNEPVPDNGLIQGTNYFNCSSLDPDSGNDCRDNSTRPVFSVQPNQRYRYRLINTGSFAIFQFSIDNHSLSVIEADGTVVQPTSIHRLEIAVAQRYSVIFHANQTASNYWMRAEMNTFCFAVDNPVLNPEVMALVTYTNDTAAPTLSSDWAEALDVSCIDLDVASMVPTAVEEAPPPDLVFGLTTSFQIGAYQLDRAYVNGTSWSMPEVPTLNQAVTGLKAGNSNFSTPGVSAAFSSNQFVIDIPRESVVDLVILNFDDGSHPFHLHGHVFWILEDSDQQYFNWTTYNTFNTTITNPMRRDTMTIQAYGHVLIRFRADNPGLWAFHCHISWHMEAGLLMQFQTRDDIMADWTLPADVLALCPA